MGLILSIESSAKNCSVALARSGKVIRFRDFVSDQYSHAEHLHVFIKEVMNAGNATFAQLDAVAVSKGPGSYTGLRIGISGAKGLCMALGIPLISYSVPEILAREIRRLYPNADLIVPMIDARRMEVYTATYDNSLRVISPVRAVVIGEDFFQNFGDGLAVFGGDGAMKAAALSMDGQECLDLLPSATMGAELAHQKFLRNEVENLSYFEPFYLKEFIAGKSANQGNATSGAVS